jgi:hypothetical protein
METEATPITDYAKVIIKLLKQGVLYGEEQKDFAIVQKYEKQISNYFAQIGVGFVVDNENDMAYLLQKQYKQDTTDEKLQGLPNLMSIISLTYYQTLMCVVVRGALLSSEQKGIRGEDYKHTVTGKDLKDSYEKLVVEKNDKTKQREGKGKEDIQGLIDKMVELSFLSKVGEHKAGADETNFYEIKRIIKARINAEKLQEIKEKFNQF